MEFMRMTLAEAFGIQYRYIKLHVYLVYLVHYLPRSYLTNTSWVTTSHVCGR